MHEYNICFSFDSNYTEQFCVSAVSILKNSDVDDNINFYILDGGLTNQDKINIESLKNIKKFNIKYIQVDENNFKNCPILRDKDENHKDYHVTLPTYFRFKLPELLPNLDKILYLDCDVIVRTSLKELYSTDVSDFAVGMIEDVECEKEANRLFIQKYYNAGVMLINLDYWRKNNISAKLFEFASSNSDKILWQDQDVINCILDTKILSLDNKWNYQYFLYNEINKHKLAYCSIIHLSGRFKPWLIPFEHFVYDDYYSYLELTPYKNRVIEYKQKASGRFLENNLGGTETNILVNATDKDIQKVYDELDKNYEVINSQYQTISSQTDEKLEKVYKEIENSYAHTNKSVDDLKINTELEFNEKINEVYKEIENTYEYTNKRVEDLKILSCLESDRKIDKVYDEISKNYGYTNDIRDNLNSRIEDEKKGLISLYEQYVLNFDEKLIKAKDDIFSYVAHFNETISNNAKENINQLEEKINAKISNLEVKQNKQDNVRLNEFYSYANSEFSKVFKQLNDNNKNLENKIDLKSFETYKWFEENKNENKNLRENLETKVENSDFEKFRDEIFQKFEHVKFLHQKEIKELTDSFDEKLNKQRIKYETKLIAMESLIYKIEDQYKYSKKNIFEKMIEKCQKR